MLGKKRLPIFSAVALLAIFLRWLQLGSASFFFDEFYNVWASKMSLAGMRKEQLAGDPPPPLFFYYLVARGWYSFGTGEVWTRSLSAVAGLFTVLLVYLAARELFSSKAGLWAAAFTAASPLLVWYSRFNTYYSFLIMVSALSFWLLLRASKRGGLINWAAYTAAATALLFTYFFGVILIVAGWLVYFLISSRKSLASWMMSQTILVFFCGIAYFLSTQAIAAPHNFQFPSHAAFRGLVYNLVISPFALLAGQADSAINYTGAPGMPILHAVLFTSLIFVGVIAYLTSSFFRNLLRDRMMLAIVGFAIIMITGPLMLNLANRGGISSRFSVWAAPDLILILAFFVAALPRKAGIITGAVILGCLVFASLWQIFNVTDYGGNYRAVMATISRQRQEGDVIVGFPIYSVDLAADYYLKPPMPVTGGVPSMNSDAVRFPPTSGGWGGYRSGYFLGTSPTPALSGADLDNRLETEVKGVKRLWLLEEEDYPVPRVEKTLGSNWTEAGRWNFPDTLLILLKPRNG